MKRLLGACLVVMCVSVLSGLSFVSSVSAETSCQPICSCESCEKGCSCKCTYCENHMNVNLAGMGETTKGAAKSSGDILAGAGKETGVVAEGAHLRFDDMCKGSLKTSSDVVIGARDSTSRILEGVGKSVDGIMKGLLYKKCKEPAIAESAKVENIKPETK